MTIERPRICFINRSYWPDAEATGQLLTELCEDLAARFEVAVIAGQPNQNPDRAKYQTRGVERRQGVAIHRVRHTQLSKGTLVGRAINYVTFLVGAAWTALTMPRPNVLIVETDPPLLCLLGAWIQWWRGCRLVVYLQDIHPDIGIAVGKLRAGWFTNLLRRWFIAAYRRADRVIVLSQDMRSVIREWGVLAERIAIIPNWADTEAIYPVKRDNRFRAAQGLDRHFVVMYSGNLGLCQQLEDVLAAAEHLQSDSRIRFVLIGQGASRARLEQQVRERDLTNIMFLDYQPKQNLSDSLSAADVHLVPLDPRITRYLMPSKLYGILASGTPLIAIADAECELAELVEREQVGFVATPGDPQSLAKQIQQCSEHPEVMLDTGHRARDLAMERFNRRKASEQFATLVAAALAPQTDEGKSATLTYPMRRMTETLPEYVEVGASCEQ